MGSGLGWALITQAYLWVLVRCTNYSGLSVGSGLGTNYSGVSVGSGLGWALITQAYLLVLI